MSDNQALKEQLQKLISQKKSKRFYAEKLGIPIEKVDELLGGIKGINAQGRKENIQRFNEKCWGLVIKLKVGL